MAGTYELPEEGSPNSSQDPKIKTMLKGLNEKLNSSNLLEDSGLASPNNSTYRLVYGASQALGETAGAGIYFLANLGGNGVKNESTWSTLGFPYFYFAKADYEVAGKTQKLRLRAQVATNTVKPTIVFNIGLYPFTVAGAAGNFTATLGTLVSGSTAAVNEPPASTVTSTAGGEFAIPADGAYVLAVQLLNPLTANSTVKISAQLQTRSV